MQGPPTMLCVRHHAHHLRIKLNLLVQALILCEAADVVLDLWPLWERAVLGCKGVARKLIELLRAL